MYLFGDQVAPPDKALTVGVQVPCKELKVQRKPLTASMFAAAFFNLREQGVVGLEVVQKKVLFVKTTKVIVSRLQSGDRPGLEGAVVQNTAGGESVKDIIRSWYRRDVTDPWRLVIDEAVSEAVAQGYFEGTDAGRGKIAGAVLGNTNMTPVCEKIAPLEGEFDKFLSGWNAFQTSEPDLYRELVDDSAGAIASRVESTDD